MRASGRPRARRCVSVQRRARLRSADRTGPGAARHSRGTGDALRQAVGGVRDRTTAARGRTSIAGAAAVSAVFGHFHRLGDRCLADTLQGTALAAGAAHRQRLSRRCQAISRHWPLSIERWWAAHGRGEKLLLSFHGIPERYVRLGDPYAGQCQRTATAAARAAWTGRRPADRQLPVARGREQLAAAIHRHDGAPASCRRRERLDVACPGFAVDCLETLEEIAMQNGDFFTVAGGEALRYIPALNDSAGTSSTASPRWCGGILSAGPKVRQRRDRSH